MQMNEWLITKFKAIFPNFKINKNDFLYKTIIDNLSYLVWLKDVNGTFQMANEAFAQICNLKISEIVGKNGTEVWTNELALTYTAFDLDVINSGKSVTVEEEILTSDGLKWFEVNKIPVFDKNGKVSGILGVAKDISESKAIEIELLRSQIQTINVNKREMLLRHIVESIRSSLDINETLTFICYELVKLYNVQRVTIIEYPTPGDYMNFVVRREYKSRDNLEGILGNPKFNRQIPIMWADALENTQEYFVIDNIKDSEMPEFFKENYEAIGQKSIAVVPIKKGTAKWGVLILSEYDYCRHWTEEEISLLQTIAAQAGIAINNGEMFTTIEKTERYTRTLLDNIKDGILTINEFGIIDSCNPAIKEIFEYTSEEITGKFIDSLIPCTNDDSGCYVRVKGHFKEYLKMPKEAIGIKRSGEIFPVEIETSEISFEGKTSIVMAIRDITQRKDVERIKNEFISTVSHELRTPLTSIKGALGLISSGAMGNISPVIQGLIDIATNNSTRLIQLINDILDLEKIEAGKMIFNYEIVELSPVLEKAVEMNKSFADEFNITCEIENSLPDVMVNVDKNRLIQVITNLLSNAAKFSYSGSIVKITTEIVGNYVRVTVKDNGVGIPAKFQELIFQKFVQADSSDTRQKGGTGLGLSICKIIIEKLGGSIAFNSIEKEGSSFFFDLPLFNIESNANEEVLPSQARILVCEDDKDISSLICLILKQNGHFPDVAYNVDQAKELLAKNNYDLITVDIILPGEDGFTLIQALKESGNITPVIVISIKSDELSDELKEYFKVEEWIQKPIDHDKLINSINKAIKAKTPPKPKILHIENDPDIQKILSSLLKSQAEVYSAMNIFNAKKLLNDNRFDLVVMDINLSNGENGLEILSFIRDNDVDTTPVLIFTAHDIDSELTNKANAVLIKSKTSNQQILDTIQTLLHIT